MLNEDALRRALRTAGLAAPVRWDDVTASTNATALEMAAEGAPEWTLVAAGHQTAGRGRHGRAWVDRPGAALMCSRRPQAAVGAGSRRAALARRGRRHGGGRVGGVRARDVRCKWPNDLLVGESKVGGILGESEITDGRIGHVVLGIGVNLDPPDDVPGAGGDRRRRRGGAPDRFPPRFRRMVEGSPDEIVRRWRALSATLGQRVEATTVGGDTVRRRRRRPRRDRAPCWSTPMPAGCGSPSARSITSMSIRR